MSARRQDLYERIGPEKLRAVIHDFYERVFGDVMIGFLFAGKDRARLIEKEWEFTARLLGADVAYTGRSMREAHAASPIFGGHFERRLELLRQTLVAHEVEEEVARAWLDHQRALRPQITADRGSECKDSGVAARLGEPGPAPAGGSPLLRLGRK
ncbi:MAG: group 1 truncated hemoglobin [Kofleriaceae bacterium]